MRPLSLIHVLSSSGFGGTAVTAFRLARLLAERGHRLLFCTPPGSMWAERARAEGIEVNSEMTLRRRFELRGFFRDVGTLKRLARERAAEIVHVHRSAEYWRAALALGSAPRRTKLVRSRGVVMPLKNHGANRWLHNRRTDLVVCTAQVIFDQYAAMPGFDRDRVRLLHDGVDTETFRPGRDGSELRRALGIGPGVPVVAVVARLHAVKGHRHLIDAAPRIVAKFPSVRFILTGRDTDELLARELREQTQRLGVTDNFIFGGGMPDIPAVLAASDAFALCSVASEGSSRGTLEAMASGLPAVATDVGCLPDLVVHGQTGFLIPPRDSAALAERLIELLADPGLRRRMGEAARKRVEERFAERDVAARLERLYAERLGEGGA